MDFVIAEKTNVVPVETKTESTRYSDLITVPLNAELVKITMPRKDMLDKKVAYAIQLFLSLDGGISWRPWGGMGTVGGEVIDSATKEIATESGMTTKLLESTNPNRMIKATLSVSAETKTGLDVEFK